MGNQNKDVFISHIHEDDAGLKPLKDLLAKNGMTVRDSSINSDKPNNATSPDYIKQNYLAPAIKWASTLIVYITPETKDSYWVNWEIEYAHKQGKTIVGVWEYGCQGCEIPEALDAYGNAVVGWQGNKIINAINGTYEGFETPDGKPTVRPIRRHRCG